ncbi:MAG: hypothetical protein AVDCRST_MAG91-3119 [uncultured Sphingomonadaceae bacterium]|uniref:Uncharacterized protein n=1 Tax=uncultured Sphingomonadaceae bacterium TaxID=169976 RepID=A0A6J4TWE5_9SPHN|nr:MAG: hypothetical protein AVDCRST_MAG91-3119 [uncultured Sphingomonadaceae bacterium]
MLVAESDEFVATYFGGVEKIVREAEPFRLGRDHHEDERGLTHDAAQLLA